MKLYYFKLILLLGLIVSCDNNEENLPPDPIIETLGSEVYSNGGVMLNGNMVNIGDLEIIDYGFKLFSSSGNFTYNVNHSAELPASLGTFEVEITQGLYPDAEYNFTAFARTEEGTYQGETLSFYSRGSATPRLLSCEPPLVHISDTITLTGLNFPTDTNRIGLQFGDAYAQVISATSTEIVFKVPKPIEDSRQLKLSAYDKTVFGNGLLDLFTPIINTVSPDQAFFGETITLEGDHFNINPNFTSCTIGGFDAEIISTSRNAIEVIIPEEVNYANTEIILNAQNQEVNSSDFSLRVPQFLEVPNIIYTSKYFDVTVDISTENQNNFKFDDYESYPPYFVDENTLRFSIPSSIAFDDRDVNLRWIINDLEIEAPHPLRISNPFYKIKDETNNFFPFSDYNVFTINNEAVVVGNIELEFTSAKYLFKFDSVAQEWVNQGGILNNGSLYPLQDNNKSFVYSEYDNSIYTLMGSGYTNNFIKINPNTGEITQKTSNTSVGFYGTGFAYNNKVFFTNGYNTDIWANNLDTDTWEVVTTVPYDTSNFRNFDITIYVDCNYAYFLNGGFNTVSHSSDFWRLNLDNYVWEQLPDNPSPNEYGTIYKIGDELHVVTDFVWKYNPNTATWTQLEDSGITSGLDTRLSSFIQNDIPYVIKEAGATNVTYLSLFFGDLINN
jgi:hypothetical protein